MFNESLCDSSGILNIIYLIKSALEAIKIAVPVILIVMSMFDVIKMITKADVKIGTVLKKIMNRMLAAVLVFFAIPIINMGMSILGTHTNIQMTKCWTNATPQTIATLKENEAKEAKAEEEASSGQSKVDEEEKRKLALELRKAMNERWTTSTSENENVGNSPTMEKVKEGSCVFTGRPYASNVNVGEEIVKEARKYVGKTPYVWAGTNLETGVDCSGFVQQIMANFGAEITRTTYTQLYDGEYIGTDLTNAKPGDIIVFDGHVGIYSGNGNMVHASNQLVGIIEDPVSYSGSIQAVRRIICNG